MLCTLTPQALQTLLLSTRTSLIFFLLLVVSLLSTGIYADSDVDNGDDTVLVLDHNDRANSGSNSSSSSNSNSSGESSNDCDDNTDTDDDTPTTNTINNESTEGRTTGETN
jgi:hypothetical protein